MALCAIHSRYLLSQSSASKAIQLTTAGTQELCNSVYWYQFGGTRPCNNVTANDGWVTLTSGFEIREFLTHRTTIREMTTQALALTPTSPLLGTASNPTLSHITSPTITKMLTRAPI